MTADKAPDWFMELFFGVGKAWRAERAKSQLNATAEALWQQSALIAYCARIADDSTDAANLRDIAEELATLTLRCVVQAKDISFEDNW